MAAIIPVIIGGRVIQLAAPRAMALIESGLARYLPSMRTVGSQSAGPNASGPFFRSGATNFSPVYDRPGLIGRGLAGGAAVGSMAISTPRAPVAPAEGRVPIPPGLIQELDKRGAMSAEPVAPVSTDMSASFLDGPSTYSPGMEYGRGDSPRETLVQEALARTAAPAKRVMQAPPPPRPREPAAPPPAESFVRRMFSGPDYQSMNALAEGPERGYTAPVMQSGRVNWGDPESAADFFRADRAAMAMREGRAEGGGIPEGMMGMRPMPVPDMPMGDMGGLPPPPTDMGMPAKKPAGQAGGRDAAIAKALDIIHELVLRGR